MFDLPDPRGHGEKRETTTTPVQQLYFLNSPFVRQAAAALAKSAVAGLKGEDAAKALFRRVLLRDPTAEELETALRLVKPAREGGTPAWELLAQALLGEQRVPVPELMSSVSPLAASRDVLTSAREAASGERWRARLGK